MKEIEKIISGKYKNHVLPFLWQKGESKEIIDDYLSKIKNSDIHEICIESRPHPEFGKEKWWEDLEFIIEKCKEYGLKIWILDDSHFPTGYANGALKDKPELKKKLLTHRTYDVIGPQQGVAIRVENIYDPTEEFYGAVIECNGEYIDITDMCHEGILNIDVMNEGLNKITIIAITRKNGFREDYINVIDKESCNILIESIYEPHYQHFSDEFGKTILGFFTDEPGFMNEKGNNGDSVIGKEMLLPWSDEFESEWKNMFSSQSIINLSKLWGRKEENAYIRYTYMDIVTSLYKKNFDENIGKWCRERNVMHIGHIIEDKGCHSRLGVGAGHYFRALSGQDMSGVDIVINQLVPGMDEGYHSYGRGSWDMEFFNYALAKLGSSLAHIDPLKKGRAMAEVFGAFGWHEGLRLMKWIADHFLVRGVNYFVPHAFSQAPFPDKDCPPHFYAHGNNIQFKYFSSLMTYINKTATLLSDGKPNPTAAILYHAEAEWCGEYMSIQVPAKELTRNQIDFDFICCDVFSEREHYNFSISEKKLSINGIDYSCLIIPYSKYISEATFEVINECIQQEVSVIFINELPIKIIESNEKIINNGYTVVKIENLIQEMKNKILFEIQLDNYQPWLRYYCYKKNDVEYKMFVNEHPKEVIKTNVIGLNGTKYNLLTSESEYFNGYLELSPYESCIVVEEEKKSENISLLCTEELKGKWKLSYSKVWNEESFIEVGSIKELKDINKLMNYKTGIFRYELDFYSGDWSDIVIKIDEANEIAHVHIDNKDCGSCICPPYVFKAENIKEGKHHIKIDVINTLDKEIVDIFSLLEPMKPTGLEGKVWIKYNEITKYK